MIQKENLSKKTVHCARLSIVVFAAVLSLAGCGTVGNSVKQSQPDSANRSAIATNTATDNSAAKNQTTVSDSTAADVSTGANAYEQAYNKLRGAGSYHFVLKTLGSNSSTADGVYEASRRAWQFKHTAAGTTQEWLKINSTNKNYVKKSGAWSSDFVVPEMVDVSVDLIEGFFAPSRPDMQRASLPALAGTENINGEQCDHYHFETTTGMFKGIYDAYLSKTKGEFVRFDSKDDTNKFELSVDKLNQPVEIDAPQ